MKRQIKFRCWDVQGQKMFVPKDIPNDSICSIPEDDDEQFFVHMQFTGLFDRNKKEIFEGDIVRYAFDWDYSDVECNIRQFKKGEKAHVYIGHIEWEGEEFAHFVINPKRMNLAPFAFLIEVIGNIFENPELLKHDTKSLQ